MDPQQTQTWVFLKLFGASHKQRFEQIRLKYVKESFQVGFFNNAIRTEDLVGGFFSPKHRKNQVVVYHSSYAAFKFFSWADR